MVDHHAAEPHLPPALAVVNPNRADQVSPVGELAAVGVTFLLVVALNRRLRARGHFARRAEPDLRRWLDLVALGTVCDVVPLRGLNRALVCQGLKVAAGRGNPGLAALAAAAGLTEPPERRAFRLRARAADQRRRPDRQLRARGRSAARRGARRDRRDRRPHGAPEPGAARDRAPRAGGRRAPARSGAGRRPAAAAGRGRGLVAGRGRAGGLASGRAPPSPGDRDRPCGRASARAPGARSRASISGRR